MNIFETISQRRSCRTFNGLRLDHQTTARINELTGHAMPLFKDVAMPAVKLVNSDNAPRQLGTYGFISGARQFLVMAYGETLREQVQAGFVFESMILSMTAEGLATCWLGGTFRRGPFAQAMGDVADGRNVGIVSPVGHPTPKSRLAERLMRRMVKADGRKPFASLFKGVAEDTTLGKILGAVRLAPSSSNSQPWRCDVSHDERGKYIVTFSCATNNRFSAIDMGIAYCHFILASQNVGLEWNIDPQSEPLSLRFVEA